MIDEAINKRVLDLHEMLTKFPFAGFVESVPAYASLAVFYDVSIVNANCHKNQPAHKWVHDFIERLLEERQAAQVAGDTNVIVIPVCYNGADLEIVAATHHLSTEEVVRYHSGKIYRVFMIGFLPGFAYMGSVDERIATPRHSQPRTNVKAGSVGIAGLQTGIYPVSSPGGWQLIGQTPIRLFDASKDQPCLLKAGDKVRYTSISKEEFDKLDEY